MFPPSSHNTAFRSLFNGSFRWDRMGYITPLLPFIEQQPLYDDVIAFTLEESSAVEHQQYGMTDHSSRTRRRVPALLCPSDGNKDLPDD